MQAPSVKGFGNEETYLVRTPTPIQQALDDKFFECLSQDVEIVRRLNRSLQEDGINGMMNIDTAVEVVEEYVDDLLASADFFMRELTQICQDYLDWTHLTMRICENYSFLVKESQK